MISRLIPIVVTAATLCAYSTSAGAVQCITTRQPGQIPSAKLVVIEGDASVQTTFCGGSAGYTSDSYLASPDFVYVGTGHVTPSGTTIDIGSFIDGTELVFAIYVRNTGYWYYSGPGSRNPDGIVHAAVTDNGGGNFHVGFEDLFGGGDRDYDDINLVVTSTGLAVVPDSPADTDGDGVPDYTDNCLDSPNADQVDANGNRVGDACETPACSDPDSDGVCDPDDNCPILANADQADTDAEGQGDVCDPCPLDALNDADGDGSCADADTCPGFDDNADADGDGAADACDACPFDAVNDQDGDGICGDQDNCPVTANSNQEDTDADGEGDECDADDDSDGVVDGADNCPLIANPDQSNFDADGVGDACDYDDDGDSVADGLDSCLYTAGADIVDGTGCSIADLVPCWGNWKNHGAYVRAVAHEAERFLGLGLITAAQKDAVVSAAAQSSCGKK